MIHAFMLVVVLGAGEEARQQPNPMYFRSIDVCQYYAKRIPRQYGNYGSKYMAVSYTHLTLPTTPYV